MTLIWYLRLRRDNMVQTPLARDGRYGEVHQVGPVDKAQGPTVRMSHFKVVFSAGWHREAYRTDLPRECQECQTSCQSACKTSCTVSNQSCPLGNVG